MVSHSSHTNHELSVLVIQVTNVSFVIEAFYEKGLIIVKGLDLFEG